MRQILNLTYRVMSEGKTKIELARLQEDLTPPSEREAMISKRNMQSMRDAGLMRHGMVGPAPKKRKPKAE